MTFTRVRVSFNTADPIDLKIPKPNFPVRILCDDDVHVLSLSSCQLQWTHGTFTLKTPSRHVFVEATNKTTSTRPKGCAEQTRRYVYFLSAYNCVCGDARKTSKHLCWPRRRRFSFTKRSCRAHNLRLPPPSRSILVKIVFDTFLRVSSCVSVCSSDGCD